MSTDKINADTLFYVSTGPRVACIDKASGEVIWATVLDRNLGYGSIVLDDDRIIAAGHRLAACLDRATGDIRWQTDISSLSSPTSIALDKSVPGGQIFLGCNGLLFSLYAETGELLWENGLKGWGYNHMCLRVPGALTAQPKVTVVSSGKSTVTHVLEDRQE